LCQYLKGTMRYCSLCASGLSRSPQGVSLDSAGSDVRTCLWLQRGKDFLCCAVCPGKYGQGKGLPLPLFLDLLGNTLSQSLLVYLSHLSHGKGINKLQALRQLENRNIPLIFQETAELFKG
jgi:hypothetical protein